MWGVRYCVTIYVYIDKPARLISRLLFGFASDSVYLKNSTNLQILRRQCCLNIYIPPSPNAQFSKVSATFLCSSVWRNAKSERNRFQILFWYQIFMILIPILFSIPNVFRFRYRSFFDTKFFWNQYRYFFWYQIFFNRYHQKTWTSFETELKLFSSKFVDWIMSLLKCRDP